MNKLSNRITGAVVFLFISAMLVLTVFNVNEKASVSDNREIPEFSAESLMNGRFGEELGKYMSGVFAGRSHWISANARIESELCESIVNGVYISESMLLDTEFSHRPSAEKSAEKINRFAENYDGAVYFVAVPTSSGVYSDILPEYLVRNTDKQQIDSFYEQLVSSIRTIDAYNILKMLKENYIFYRSDTKWTSYGAYCVYRTVIQKLGFLPSAYDKYTIEHITDSYQGNLCSRTQYMKSKPDILDIYEYSGGAEVLECLGYDNDGTEHISQLYDRKAAESGDIYNLYMCGDFPLVKIKTSLNNERKLLVIKDSFADCFIPFLIQHYSEIAVVSPENITGNLSDVVNPGSYEQTLFLFGIDSLSKSNIFNNLE